MSGPWELLAGPAGALRYYSTATPPGGPPRPMLLLCHDLPQVRGGAAEVGRTFPSLADALAEESGWQVAIGTLRGAGSSEGDFSVGGWMEDLRCLVHHLAGPTGQLRLAGFGLGGLLALRLALDDERVRGVATLAAPADVAVDDREAAALLERCRRSGVIRRADFPADAAQWAAELAELRPLEAAAAVAPRPSLVIQGAEDHEVPTAAARALAEAGGPGAELRLVPGAGHWLRADPRVVATLIGWLERQR